MRSGYRSLLGMLLTGILIAGLLPARAQTSASYRLVDYAFNAGGVPAQGSVLASPSYRVSLDTIGEGVLGDALSSASYRQNAGFVAAHRPSAAGTCSTPGQVCDDGNACTAGDTCGTSTCGETFDSVSAPALPAGWTTQLVTGQTGDLAWQTTTTSNDTAPNSATTPDPGHVTDKVLDSTVFPITSASAQLTFRNSYSLEDGFDGAVLEIKIGGGSFQDIIAAGGSFVTGGYTRTISTAYSSPIAGRMAWSGNSAGFLTTMVNLPASANGQSVVLRWRVATDVSVAGTGQFIDTITLTGCGAACNLGTPVSCDDGNLCTTDSCAPATGCSHVNNTLPCNDGNICTMNDACEGGVCTGPNLNCDDGNGCTLDTCDLQTGCVHTPSPGSACNDGNVCTAGDTCALYCGENFDGVSPPALPASWTTQLVTGQPGDVAWGTSTSTYDTAPNAAYTADQDHVTDKVLTSPAFPINSASAQLTFRNGYILEDTFDGGVLEIKIGGGSFQDILAAGGSFVTGGYTRTISSAYGSPIAGRMAWSGTSGGFFTTTVNLPASANGQNVVFRWRVATDVSVAGYGQFIDSITLTGCGAFCNPGAPVNCDDGNPCTTDACDAASQTGCYHTPTPGASCEDGNLCTTGDTCVPRGTCQGGAVPGEVCDPTDAGACAGACTLNPSVRCRTNADCQSQGLGSCSPGPGSCSAVPSCSEYFDRQLTLPAAWTTQLVTGVPGDAAWNPRTVSADTPPNAVFTDDPAHVTDKILNSPAFPITSASAQLTFKNSYSLEEGFDGAVLEIKIGGGSFQDIVAAGGSFATGGYTHAISTAYSSPIAGRMAWSGDSGGLITTRVNLPASANGQSIVLRWRVATDVSVEGVGQFVDTIVITGCGATCNAGPSVTCDDGNVCTTDACSPATGCSHANNTLLCNDANSCTVNDTCVGGICRGAPIVAPPEVQNLLFQANKSTLVWDSASGAGPGTVHDVVRGRADGLPVGGGSLEICLASGIGSATTSDSTVPPVSRAFWYLVRGRNSCGTGPYGFRSSGTESITTVCP